MLLGSGFGLVVTGGSKETGCAPGLQPSIKAMPKTSEPRQPKEPPPPWHLYSSTPSSSSAASSSGLKRKQPQQEAAPTPPRKTKQSGSGSKKAPPPMSAPPGFDRPGRSTPSLERFGQPPPMDVECVVYKAGSGKSAKGFQMSTASKRPVTHSATNVLTSLTSTQASTQSQAANLFEIGCD